MNEKVSTAVGNDGGLLVLPNNAPAFEIGDRCGPGKVYRIWANGRTEGFDDLHTRTIFNGLPALIRAAYAAGVEEGRSSINVAQEIAELQLEGLLGA